MTSIFPQINVSHTLTVLLDASLRCALLFALAGVVSWLLRKRSAALRHGVWTTAVVLALFLPVLSAVLPSWRLGVLPDVVRITARPETVQPTEPVVSSSSDQDAAPHYEPVSTSAQQESLDDKSFSVAAAADDTTTIAPENDAPAVAAAEKQPSRPAVLTTLREISLSTWILIVWALGVAGMLISLLAGTIGIRRLARKSRHITDPGILAMKDRLCADLAIHTPVLMLQSDESFVPVTWGIWWPTVLLPREAKQWSSDRLRMVLLHELAHIKRGDCLIQLLVQLARAMYWFHPLVWWAARNLRIQRERACDDLVLVRGVAGPDYADQLLQIVRSYRSGKGTPLAAVAMARRSQFESRLLSVLDTARRRSGLSRNVAWAILAVALAVAVPLAALQPVARAEKSAAGKTASSRQFLSYVHDTPTGRMSYSDCGAAVRFERDDGSNRVTQIRFCASRYGYSKPPKEDFNLYLLDEDAKILGTFEFPYGMIKRTQTPQWYTLRIKPTVVPKVFYAAFAFNAERTKGVYVGLDTKGDAKNSFLYFEDAEEFRKLDGKGAWMIRAVLMGKGNSETPEPEPTAKSEEPRKQGAFPRIVSTSPAALANDVDPKVNKITVTFDQPMMDGSWSWTGGGETFPNVTGKIHYDTARTTCTLPVKLEAGKVYWVGVNSPSHKNFKTMDRKPAKRYVILFATKSADGKPTPIPEDLLRVAKQINAAQEQSSAAESEALKGKLINWVEDFFSRNYRDITARKTLQWGDPETTPGGNFSIRYKFLATIRNRDKQIIEKRFTFTSDGKFVSAETIEQSPAGSSSPASKADKLKAENVSARGWALWQRRKLPEAEKMFLQAVELDPANTNALNGLGWSQFNQGKALNAKEAFEKCISLEPKHPAALNGLGWIAKGQGKTDEAIAYWTKAVEAAPSATAALNGLTQTYMEQKKYDEAIRYYEMWLKVEPNNADAKKGLKEAQGAAGTVQAAVKATEQWLKLIDADKYGQSWTAAATAFRKAVAKDQWPRQVQAARKPLGNVQSRKVISSTYTTTLPGAPDGQYVVIQFQTAFENKADAVETVTPMKDKDGTWRVSGYYVK
ncbi:MAG: DUF4019 domain-containing protein [Phycisphaerae bacterium]|nr:DUF4019 domain-containing protein [Phycisphaerae bacterium]